MVGLFEDERWTPSFLCAQCHAKINATAGGGGALPTPPSSPSPAYPVAPVDIAVTPTATESDNKSDAILNANQSKAEIGAIENAEPEASGTGKLSPTLVHRQAASLEHKVEPLKGTFDGNV
ncbi:hypothetical protein C8R46DRAFT_1230420 [Mycena filopes]|nr:hypothetical protein C8R46DRAFT_1230420 [Mycena filopes]